MGRTSVTFDVANNDDLVLESNGHKKPEDVRRLSINGIVDTGATSLVVSRKVAQTLGLRKMGQVMVKYADSRKAVRDIMGDIDVSILGRSGRFTAVIEEDRPDALIGAVVLETLDLLVDSRKQCLVPRQADMIFAELE